MFDLSRGGLFQCVLFAMLHVFILLQLYPGSSWQQHRRHLLFGQFFLNHSLGKIQFRPNGVLKCGDKTA